MIKESADKVCKLCRYVRPKRRRICRGGFADSKLLFRVGGHWVTEVTLDPLPTDQPWLKWRLQREGLNLYTSRVRVPRSLGSSISTRLQEGKSVNHLREQLATHRRYKRAYERALADMGVLSIVERIISRRYSSA
jgi:hypothetical protein